MKIKIIYTLWLVALLIVTAACRDENFPELKTASVETIEASDISGSTAVCGGIIVDNGGFEISTRGICWDTVPDPELGINAKEDTSGLESFNCLITGLSGGTDYYVRAYATNNGGISYGENIGFTTKPVPVLATSDVTNITGNSAVCGGNIIKNFGLQLTEVGVCWGTEANPDVNNSKATAESVANSFMVNISGLKPSTQYHIRSYAINENGEVGYGENRIFNTAISDYDGNVYTSVKIGNHIWMVKNYRSTHFNDGTPLNHSFHSGDTNQEYGASYSWNDVIQPNFAPAGWHVATDDEWRALYEFVQTNGLLLKEQGTDHWNTDNGTNETGFTAFGSAHIYGAPLKAEGTWWASNENSPTDGLRWSIFDSGDMGRYANDKNMQFPVRLVKD